MYRFLSLILLFIAQLAISPTVLLYAQGIRDTQNPVSVALTNKNGAYIIKHPHSMSACIGSQVKFSVKVIEGLNLKFQWQSSIDNKTWSDIPDANTSIYDGLYKVTRAHDGLRFRVRVSPDHREGGEQFSEVAMLHVDGELACIKHPQSQLIAEGGTIQLDAEFSSTDRVEYQWQYSPYGSGIWLDLENENQPTLSVHKVSSSASGSSFRVLARHISGCDSTMSDVAFIEVAPKPHIQITNGFDAYCNGGSSTFSVLMRGGSGAEKMQWQESRDQGKTYIDIKGAQNQSFTINRIMENMAGYRYRARVTLPGDIELYTTEIKISVHGAVAFNEQPKSQVICPGDVIKLEAKVDFKGSEPEYRWQESKNGHEFTDILGSRGKTLEIPTDIMDRAKRYYRAVVNAGNCHSMFSDVATIEFNSLDGIEPKVKDVIVPPESTEATLSCDFRGDQKIYSYTWQWSANDGSTWQSVNFSQPHSLRLTNIRPDVEGTYLYRVKILNKKCARLYYSEPARLWFK